MIASWRLPLCFDPELLRADTERIAPDEWAPHFNTRQYEGEWSGVALRAARGSALALYPDPVASEGFTDTEVLERCPYFRQVLATFACPLESARLLKLAPGAHIREHRDYKLGLEDGVLRIHVPITSNPAVDFILQGERVVMGVGEAWYMNFNLPHSVANRGQVDRVHLVIDAVVNDWVLGLFPPGAASR